MIDGPLKTNLQQPETPPFSVENILSTLEKFNLGDKKMVYSGKYAKTEMDLGKLAQKIFDNQGKGIHSSEDEQTSRKVLPERMQSHPTDYLPSEIKKFLEVFNLPEDMKVQIAKMIIDTNPKKSVTAPDQVNIEEMSMVQDTKVTVEPAKIDAIITSSETSLEKEKMLEKFYNDPNLIHFVGGTYDSGNHVYRIVQGGERKRIYNSGENDLKLKSIDLNGYSRELQRKLFGDRAFQASPVTKTYEQGKGYGIVFAKADHVGRPGFGALWTVMTKEDAETRSYIENNPEILLKLYKEYFNDLQKEDPNHGQEKLFLRLINKDFIDLDTTK